MQKRTWYLLEAAAVIISLVIAVTLMIPKFLDSQQNILSAHHIPDDNFRAFIKELMQQYSQYLELEPGQPITKELAAKVVGIMDCSNLEIESLKGIEYFTNIHELKCSNNNLKELDLSKQNNLHSLYCDHNELESIVFPSNCTISTLNASHNRLQSIDLNQLLCVSTLVCGDNQITSFTVSNQSSLKYLSIQNNKLDDLSAFKPLIGLTTFFIEGNTFSTDDMDSVTYFNQTLNKFIFEKQTNGTFQVDPIEGVVGFLTSNP